MTLRNYTGAFGALLSVAGGLSPMLRLPIIGTWNYPDIDVFLAAVVFAAAAAGLLSAVLSRQKIVYISGWVILVVTLFTLLAVYLKVNDYFSFIPFKKLASAAARMVRYRWEGWCMLLAGGILMILSGLRHAVVRRIRKPAAPGL